MFNISEIVGKNLDLTQNKPLKHLVYEAFRKTIILGEIPAGQRINEKEFSEVMNISRTPIRYALKKLESEKLVQHVQGVGVIVKGISIKDAYEIYDIRKALDVLAFVKAMKLMTDDDFTQLRLHLENAEQLNKNNEVDKLLKNFSQFNAFIYDKSQMQRLKSIVTNLQEYLIYFRDISIRAKERCTLALNEHWSIYQSMLKQDEEQVRLIIIEHLDHSLSFIIKEMEQRNIRY
jgi:DNA-binding GntR family transcriptional regulator